MTTKKVSMPDKQKRSVDEKLANRGFSTSSAYALDAVRREQDRPQLRQLVLDGIDSGRGRVADASYFASLREKIGQRTRTKPS